MMLFQINLNFSFCPFFLTSLSFIVVCIAPCLSRFVEQQVELSFKTGEVILVYGEMDEDGFFMGELDGVRGLVPSNFLTEAPEQYNNAVGGGPSGAQQRNVAGSVAGGVGSGVGVAGAANRGGGVGGRLPGPGARGPPPPPRDGMMAGPSGVQIGGGVGPMGQMGQMGSGGVATMNQLNQQQQPQQQQQRSGPAAMRKGNFILFRL